MSHSATAEQTKSQSSRLGTEVGERSMHLTNEHRTSQEIEATLSSIPSGSVTARTAGALRVPGPQRTIEEERAAFQQAVAEENARPVEK
ncbi:MAG: hypothetical protein H0V37_05495 [Chloroflexia bacterium]|nr:hypothetical protein [Chloroflexia bacterium]